MDIEGREESTNIEDRRGDSGFSSSGFGGGGGGFGMGRIALGGGGGVAAIILAVIVALVNQYSGGGGAFGLHGGGGHESGSPEDAKLRHFVGVVFGDTERVWGEQFRKLPKPYPQTYPPPTLVLFTDNVRSACGNADTSVGPFYCPGDQKVYIDLSFYHEMDTKLHAPGDFARAYVIAHEVGHHVQKQLWPEDVAKVDKARGGPNGNQMSVRLELQADYLAGVWAHYGQEKYNFIQPGDIDSALNAAKQIGDDHLQDEFSGRVKPDTFTHGTSAQRQYWFKKGFETGSVLGAHELFERPYNKL